jgi:hypothetical protein
MKKDEWITPQYVLDALCPFDLDPCAAVNQPWPTAAKHYTVQDNGLIQPWAGRVWCNPPYGSETAQWLRLCHRHGDAVALIFARTETAPFFECVWEKADAVLFLKGRITFHHVTGERAEHNGGAPSVLVAYGGAAARVLEYCSLPGKFIEL